MSEESNKLVSINTGSSEGNSKKTTRGATDGRACAACKYKRRKCAPNCVLATYFPPENRQQFRNAHKLFGLKHLNKHLDNALPHQKDNTMKTLIFEGNARARDPVGGCQRIVEELLKRIKFFTAELQYVKQYLAWYRAQAIENEIQKFNPPMGTNIDAASGEENRNSSFDESLKYCSSTHPPPRFDYRDRHDAAFDNIPHRSEDFGGLVLGSSYQRFNTPTGTNIAAGNREENRNSSIDESLMFCSSTHAPPRFDYHDRHDCAFDNIPHRSEDVGALVLGSSHKRCNTPIGTNIAAPNREENRNYSIDESLKFCSSIHAPPRFDYHDRLDAALDNSPHRSEDVGAQFLGSSSDKVVVPRVEVEAEADDNYVHQVTDLKNAASTFTLRN